MSSKVKTKVCNLKYVFITGEGKNQAMPGEPERMQFVASVVMPKGGEAHKNLLSQIEAEWETYKAQFGVKGKPKTNGIKDEYQKDPSGELDPDTEEVKRIPTGNVIATFKTNTTWPDGNAQVVNAYVPLSEMFGYIGDLRSKTQGRAVYSMQFDSYAEVPRNVADEIIGKSRGE